MSSKVGDLKKNCVLLKMPELYLRLILNYRDLTLHQNRWHCDCHLLALHNWLQNFTVPNSVEPRCHSPPRLISEPIKNLSPQEFACIPKVSPTSMYLEVIEGKNMSLVCSIEVRSKSNNLGLLDVGCQIFIIVVDTKQSRGCRKFCNEMVSLSHELLHRNLHAFQRFHPPPCTLKSLKERTCH